MTTDEQLRDALEKWREGARQAQLRWVTVDKVDKENKAMDVTGVIDQLEYYDVQLGMGALCIYPKPGTTCLVGIIEGQETERLNLIEKDINSLKQKLSGWTPVPNDGGSALKTALSSYISESLKETQVRDIENERVKQ